MKKILTNLFTALGFQIRLNRVYKGQAALSNRLNKYLNMGLPYEEKAFAAMQKVKFNTMLPYEPLATLFAQVAWVEENKLPGCFVECGVWKGGASGMMALANLEFGPTRRHLHLFDAFGDICQPDEEKDEQKLVQEVKVLTGKQQFAEKPEALTGIYNQFGGAGTIEINKKLLEQEIDYPSSYLHYHQGWFQDTVPADANQLGEIAILRLDGDWYESTKVCMEALYPKVVNGGLVIIDDYGYNSGCRQAVHEVLGEHNHHPYINYVNDTCRYFFKP